MITELFETVLSQSSVRRSSVSSVSGVAVIAFTLSRPYAGRSVFGAISRA